MVFRYEEENIVDRILEAFEGKHFAGASSAVFVTPDAIVNCAQIADKLGKDEKTRVVSTMLPSNMRFTGSVPNGVRIAACNGTIEFVPGTKMAKLFGMVGTPNDVGSATWANGLHLDWGRDC